jgi:hypothetical protein
MQAKSTGRLSVMPAISLVGAILLWQVRSEEKAEDVQRVVSSFVGDSARHMDQSAPRIKHRDGR